MAPKTWGLLVAVAILLGVSGPFDTANLLRFGPRLAYWATIVFATFASGAFVHNLVAHFPPLQRVNSWIGLGVAGGVTGIVVGVVLLLINWLAFGLFPVQADYTIWILANAIVVSIVVSVIFGLFPKPTTANTVQQTPEPTRILQRLDVHKRGALISLSVQDHYVEITTTNGQDLVLLRLSDAIAETTGVNGMQVHRSHWIALDQIISATRTGDKAKLLMSDGREIPVSRSYVKAVRDVGLLAK